METFVNLSDQIGGHLQALAAQSVEEETKKDQILEWWAEGSALRMMPGSRNAKEPIATEEKTNSEPLAEVESSNANVTSEAKHS